LGSSACERVVRGHARGERAGLGLFLPGAAMHRTGRCFTTPPGHSSHTSSRFARTTSQRYSRSRLAACGCQRRLADPKQDSVHGTRARATRTGAPRGARCASRASPRVRVNDCAPRRHAGALRHVGALRQVGVGCSHGVHSPWRRRRERKQDGRKMRRRVQGQIRTSICASSAALVLAPRIILFWSDLCMPPNGHQRGPARSQRNARTRPRHHILFGSGARRRHPVASR
jgi:hypothetical protein